MSVLPHCLAVLTVVTVVVGTSSLWGVSAAAAEGAEVARGELLLWHEIADPLVRGALCNDFSKAGYFIRTNSISAEQESPSEVNSTYSPTGDEGSGNYDDMTPTSPEKANNSTGSKVTGGGGDDPPSRSSLHRRKWVIYLEGGGGCTTPTSCNERFIRHDIREQFAITTTDVANASRQMIDVGGAWRRYGDRPLEITSKLMTSLNRFVVNSDDDDEEEEEEEEEGEGTADQRGSFYAAAEGVYHVGRRGNDTSHRRQWGVRGRAILSTSREENPDFHAHNHVLIPYCSSDLWLKATEDYQKVLDPDFSFSFDPEEVRSHQFTFRGVAIFRSVIGDLFDSHGLSAAEEVVLVGSSAGGVGAMNHAPWLRWQLRDHAQKGSRLYVILDSAWFIDFRGEITNQVKLLFVPCLFAVCLFIVCSFVYCLLCLFIVCIVCLLSACLFTDYNVFGVCFLWTVPT